MAIKEFLDRAGVTYLWAKIAGKLDEKVDKVDGKGLSTNDLTDDLVTKIQNAAAGNISLDYNDLTNRPGLATATTQGFMSAADKVKLNNMETTITNGINAAMSSVTKFEVVNQLPSRGETGKIYLVPKEGGSGDDVKDEYIWTGGAYELIGSTAADLTGYLQDTDFHALTDAEIEAILSA